MQAIAFEADIVDEFLRIPNFELFKNQHVRVVIEHIKNTDHVNDGQYDLALTAQDTQQPKKTRLTAIKLDTTGFKFDRNDTRTHHANHSL